MHKLAQRRSSPVNNSREYQFLSTQYSRLSMQEIAIPYYNPPKMGIRIYTHRYHNQVKLIPLDLKLKDAVDIPEWGSRWCLVLTWVILTLWILCSGQSRCGCCLLCHNSGSGIIYLQHEHKSPQRSGRTTTNLTPSRLSNLEPLHIACIKNWRLK